MPRPRLLTLVLLGALVAWGVIVRCAPARDGGPAAGLAERVPVHSAVPSEVRDPAPEPECAPASRAAIAPDDADASAHGSVGVEDEPWILAGRAFDAWGAPLVRTALTMAIEHADGSGSVRPDLVRTDDVARFEWEPPTVSAGAVDLRVAAKLDGRGFRAVLPVGDGRCALDVGDVRLEPLPLLVAGRLVGEGHVPPTRARVFVSTEPDDPAGSPLRVGEAWTDADGRFSIDDEGEFAGSRLRLDVTVSPFRRARRTAAAGADIGDWTLRRARGVEGRLLLPAEPTMASLEVVAHGTTPFGPSRASGIASIDGSFRTSGLEVGVHEFTLEGAGWLGEPLVLWGGVVEEEDGQRATLEPSTLDLSDAIAASVLHVVGADGVALTAATVTSRAEDPVAAWPLRLFEGRLVLFHRREGARATISAPGYATAVVECSGGSKTVMLERSMERSRSVPQREGVQRLELGGR